MSKNTSVDTDYFDGFDVENAKVIKHPLIAKMQANAKTLDNEIVAFFDKDVQEIIKKHNNAKDRERANVVLRALFAV